MARRSLDAAFALPEEVAAFFSNECQRDTRRIPNRHWASHSNWGRQSRRSRLYRPAGQICSLQRSGFRRLKRRCLSSPFGSPVFVENDPAVAAMGEQQLTGQKYPLLSAHLPGPRRRTCARWNRPRSGRAGAEKSGSCLQAMGRANPSACSYMSGLAVQPQAHGATLSDLNKGDPNAEPVVERWLANAVRAGCASRLQR